MTYPNTLGPPMTVRALREALAKLGSAHDEKAVEVWLPGSYLALEQTLILRGDAVLIEGNVKPGSALSS